MVLSRCPLAERIQGNIPGIALYIIRQDNGCNCYHPPMDQSKCPLADRIQGNIPGIISHRDRTMDTDVIILLQICPGHLIRNLKLGTVKKIRYQIFFLSHYLCRFYFLLSSRRNSVSKTLISKKDIYFLSNYLSRSSSKLSSRTNSLSEPRISLKAYFIYIFYLNIYLGPPLCYPPEGTQYLNLEAGKVCTACPQTLAWQRFWNKRKFQVIKLFFIAAVKPPAEYLNNFLKFNSLKPYLICFFLLVIIFYLSNYLILNDVVTHIKITCFSITFQFCKNHFVFCLDIYFVISKLSFYLFVDLSIYIIHLSIYLCI